MVQGFKATWCLLRDVIVGPHQQQEAHHEFLTIQKPGAVPMQPDLYDADRCCPLYTHLWHAHNLQSENERIQANHGGSRGFALRKNRSLALCAGAAGARLKRTPCCRSGWSCTELAHANSPKRHMQTAQSVTRSSVTVIWSA